jgi:hypothetical protein
MTEIIEAARQVQSLASQAHKEGAIIFKSLDDVLEVMIIRNGHGEPKSSDKEWVPTRAITSKIVYLCLCTICYLACY